MDRRSRAHAGAAACLLAFGLAAARACAHEAVAAVSDTPLVVSSTSAPGEREQTSDAWWTGPLIANTPSTLPRGHVSMESYLFDMRTPHADSFGSQTYVLYGLTDTFTVGILPSFGFNRPRTGPSSSGVGVGDITLHAQYRLRPYMPSSWVPAASVALEEVLPTGRYQHLGDRQSDGQGAGAYTTSLALYTQSYFWLPNGRILRGRINLSRSVSSRAPVEGASVYGTPDGFSGRARPGASVFVDSGWEYSLTRSWVLALDIAYRHADRTRVEGSVASSGAQQRPFQLAYGPSSSVFVAPAVEYSWTPNLGLLLGARIIHGLRNTPNSVTPAVALNAVF